MKCQCKDKCEICLAHAIPENEAGTAEYEMFIEKPFSTIPSRLVRICKDCKYHIETTDFAD